MFLYQNFNQSEYAISDQSICTVQQTGTKDYIPNHCRNYEIEYGLRSADYGEALGSVTFGFERSCYSSTAAFDLVHSLRIQSVSRRATKRFTRVNLFVARRETLCIRRLPCPRIQIIVALIYRAAILMQKLKSPEMFNLFVMNLATTNRQ